MAYLPPQVGSFLQNNQTSISNAFAGLANGGLGGFANGAAAGAPVDLARNKETQQKNATIEALTRAGRTDLVEYAQGTGDLQGAFNQFITDQRLAKEEAKDQKKREASAGFIQDPQLKAAYLNGQLELADVFKAQATGAPDLTTDQSNYEYGLSHPGFAEAQATPPAGETYSHAPVSIETTNWNGTRSPALALIGNKGTTKRVNFGPGVHPVDKSSQSILSPEALDLAATQYLAGDKSAITGYARSPTMRAQLANAVAIKADQMGMDGKALAAEISAYGGNVAAQRAAGTRAAQVGMAASEANQMADIALDASKAVPRGNLVPWTTMTNAVATGTSSPEMAQFVTATTSLVNAYARAVSPLGAPTDAMRAHAEQMLNTAQGPEAYAAVIAQMKKEMEAALNAPAEISSSLKTSITGPPSGADQGPPADLSSMSDADLLSQLGQ